MPRPSSELPKMTLEEIRNTFTRYYPDDAMRKTALWSMAETIILADNKGVWAPRRWFVSCYKESDSSKAIARLYLSRPGLGIWTMAICAHQTRQTVKVLVDSVSEVIKVTLDDKLKPLGGSASHVKEGEKLQYSCQVEVPAAHLSTAYALIADYHNLMIGNEYYGVREIRQDTSIWEKHQPAFIDYLRQELPDFGHIPDPERRSPVVLQHSLVDEDAGFSEPDSDGDGMRRSPATRTHHDIPQQAPFEPLPGKGSSRFVTALIDAAERERKTAIHEYVVALLCQCIADYGARCCKTQLIDAFCFFGQTAHIFEVKSVDDANELEQYRKALAQLYEYRHWQSLDDPRFHRAALWMVLSGPLTEQWLIEYLMTDRQIGVLWVENGALAGPSYNAFVGAAESARI